MNARHCAIALALGAAFAFVGHAPAAHAAGAGGAAQTESQRRPQGPAAGPAIRLPRGEGASDERAPQQTGAKDEGARAALAPQKWEYCVIERFTQHQKGLSISSPTFLPAAVIRYLAGGTEEVEGQNEEEALANAFTKLGEEGWELAAVRTEITLREGDGRSATAYFFKRPKRRE